MARGAEYNSAQASQIIFWLPRILVQLSAPPCNHNSHLLEERGGGEQEQHHNLQKLTAIFMSMEDACTSEIPPKIVQAFNDLESVMEMKKYNFRMLHTNRIYNVLWRRFTGLTIGSIPVWPWLIADTSIHNTNSEIRKLIDAEYDNFKKDPRRPMSTKQ